jgi:hypothetical protein
LRRESQKFNKSLALVICCIVSIIAVAIWPIIWVTNIVLAGAEHGVRAASPRTLFDDAQEAAEVLIVGSYRRLAATQECAPTSKTSDEKIIEIYRQVVTGFREAAGQRGERIPAEVMNFIVWKFLQAYELFEDAGVESHLAYELQNYSQQGLRPDYRRDLKLW